MRAMTIPIVVYLDVETEAFFVDRSGSSPWAGTEQAFETIEALRRELSFPGRPASFTWTLRMDPQIELAMDRVLELDRLDRIAARVEEVVVDAAGRWAERLLPQRDERRLDRDARRAKLGPQAITPAADGRDQPSP